MLMRYFRQNKSIYTLYHLTGNVLVIILCQIGLQAMMGVLPEVGCVTYQDACRTCIILVLAASYTLALPVAHIHTYTNQNSDKTNFIDISDGKGIPQSHQIDVNRINVDRNYFSDDLSQNVIMDPNDIAKNGRNIIQQNLDKFFKLLQASERSESINIRRKRDINIKTDRDIFCPT